MRAQGWTLRLLGMGACTGICAIGALAQQVPRLNLKFTDETVLSGQSGGSVFYPVRCDPSGNIYFQPGWPMTPRSDSILEITPEGKPVAVFSLDSVPDFRGAAWYRFNIGPRGGVYLLAARVLKNEGAEVAVLEFDDQGKFRSATQLQGVFRPRQIAVFPTGQFFVSGTKDAAGDAGPKKPHPFTAVFDRGGRLIKELDLPDDVRPYAPATLAQKASNAAQTVKNGNPFASIDLGDAVAGDDGNIYLVRRAAKPKVYVISAGGHLVRSFEVTPREDDAGLSGVKYATGSRLVFDFAVKLGGERRWQQILSLVDGETGQRLVDYEVAPGRVEAFACYKTDRFTFLAATADRRMAVRTAKPQ